MIIFRTLAIAVSLTVMVLALIGVVVTPMGWIASEMLFIDREAVDDPFLLEIAEINRSPYRGVFAPAESNSDYIQVLGTRLSGPRLVYRQFVRPFESVFNYNATGREFFYFLCGGIWSVVVWSYVGIGIARVCLLRLTRNEHAGLDDAFEFATEKFTTCLLAVAIPLGAVFLLCVPTFLLGLIMGFDFGTVLVGLIWFVVLALALLMSLILLGLLFGFPLIVASVAAEGQNAIDAMTRAYAYTFQRPMHYLLYIFVALLFGGICWLFVGHLTNGIIGLGYWSTAWGANRFSPGRIDEIRGANIETIRLDGESAGISQFAATTQQPNRPSVGLEQTGPQGPQGTVQGDPPKQTTPSAPQPIVAPDVVADGLVGTTSTLQLGQKIIRFWNGIAKTVAAAFIYGLFWCMASAAYLLLRKDVDETEMDEIYLADQRRTYDLPQLKSDADGIPQIQPLSPLDDTEQT
jgi:hypothetical protein